MHYGGTKYRRAYKRKWNKKATALSSQKALNKREKTALARFLRNGSKRCKAQGKCKLNNERSIVQFRDFFIPVWRPAVTLPR